MEYFFSFFKKKLCLFMLLSKCDYQKGLLLVKNTYETCILAEGHNVLQSVEEDLTMPGLCLEDRDTLGAQQGRDRDHPALHLSGRA